VRARETVSVDSKKRLAQKTGRNGFGCRHETQRRGMCPEKLLDGCGTCHTWCAGVNRAQQLQKLLRGPGWKAVDRVGNDIGVHILCEMEADRHAPRSRVRICVRDHGNAGCIGEADCYRCGTAMNVRRPSKRCRLG